MFKLIKSDPTVNVSYIPINGKVFAITIAMKGTEVFTADAQLGKIVGDALLTGKIISPACAIDIKEATETDLCAAQKTCPSKTLELENMISYMKACKEAAAKTAREPIRVEITNAREVGGDKIMEVARNSDGTLRAATVRQI